jgi:uncharacterized protein YuzE
MTEPISVSADLEVPAAYVTYRRSRSVETLDIVEGGAVAYDLDVEGAIVGVEILWIDAPENVEAARAFAAQRGLAFPRDLGGNLVAD